MAGTKKVEPSRFSSLLTAARDRETEEPSSELPPDMVDANKDPNARPMRGRPRAKRSDPNYVQVTAYIRAQTHQRAKIALLEEGKRREFSDLVEELLSEWIASK